MDLFLRNNNKFRASLSSILVLTVLYSTIKYSLLDLILPESTKLRLEDMIGIGKAYGNSVLSDRKLLNNWPEWTFENSMQPWLSRYQEPSTKNIKDNGTSIKRFPTVIGIGVRKCGTTALSRFMNLHPQFKAVNGEPHFFDSRNYQKGMEAYRQRMPKTLLSDVVFEKSPRYFVTPSAPSRIRSWNPNVKLIVVLCDPVKRAFSDYNYIQKTDRPYRKKWVSKFNSFEEHINSAISDIIKIANNPQKTLGYATFESFIQNVWNERTFQLTVLTNGMYFYYLKTWLNFFKRDQVHIIDGEMLIKNPATELKKVENFLKIDDVIKEEMFRYDYNKGFFCIRGGDCLGETKGHTRKLDGPKMSDEMKEKLSAFYRPYNEMLFALLDREFKW